MCDRVLQTLFAIEALVNPDGFLLSPPVHIAWWAYMRGFLSVCLSRLTKNHISKSTIGRSLSQYEIYIFF